MKFQKRKRSEGDIEEAIDYKAGSLKKIYRLLGERKYSDAAIRIAHLGMNEYFPQLDLLGRTYNPAEERDWHGRWGTGDGKGRRAGVMQDPVVDPYCQIVKKFCIIEATDTLQTSDYGASFYKVMNACMDRHGCLGRA